MDCAPLSIPWLDEFQSLGALPFINSVQIFENRGEIMGSSNPHPHGQIWASETLPNEITSEQAAFTSHHEAKHSCLLCDYIKLECRIGERIICENAAFVAIVPFWAVWPLSCLLSRKSI